MFSSLCARLKSFRKDDDDARIQRKARDAAKSISKTATKDLAEWEEKNGYKTTKTTTSSPSPSGSHSPTLLGKSKHSFTSLGKSSRAFPSFTRHASEDTKEAGDPLRQPQFSLPDAVTGLPTAAAPLTESLPTFGASTDSKPPVTPCSDSKSDPSTDDERLTLKMQVEEKERLLEEIQAIRKSITQLKTADDQQQSSSNRLSVNTSHLQHTRTASGSPRSGQTPTTSSTIRRSAPWLTSERSSRAQSMYAASPASIPSSPIVTPDVNPQRSDTVRTRTRSVAEIFAGDSPAPSTWPMHHVSTAEQSPPRLQLPDDIVAPASETTSTADERPKAVTPPPATHRRSTSQGAVSGSRPKSQVKMPGDVPPVPSLKKYPNVSPVLDDQQPAHARPRQTAGDVPQQRQSKPRQIIDTPEQAQKRYSAALGRSRSPSAQDLKRRSMINGNMESAHRRETASGSGSMTLSELQERHLAKLKQMQSPTSEKLLQEQALSLAKAEWERRTRIERQEQQRKMKERAEAERLRLVAEQQQQQRSASRPSLSVSGQNARRSLSEEVPKGTQQSVQAGPGESDGMAGPKSPLMTAKRMSGAQKAREWRQSLVSLSEETQQRGLQHDAVNRGSSDEFGHMRARAKSTLGLERPQRQGTVKQGEGPGGGFPCASLPHSSSLVAPAMTGSHSHSPGGREAFATATCTSPGPAMASTSHMARSSSHSPGYGQIHPASPQMDPSIMMTRSHSYFATQPPAPAAAPARGRRSFNATGNPSSSPRMPSMPPHKRQLTATDLRRLQEGAGPGRRPQSVALGYEASRMPQRVG